MNLNELKEMQLRETKTNRIQQMDARAYKDRLHAVMRELFERELDLDVYDFENGLLLEIPHNELGSVVIETKFVIKSTDYDISSNVEAYAEKVEAQKEKRLQKEKQRQKREL